MESRNSLVLSIFPGIDLLGRAFEEEGYCVVRGPDVLWGGDIREFHPPSGVFEGVIGGPPCQPFVSNLAKMMILSGYGRLTMANLISLPCSYMIIAQLSRCGMQQKTTELEELIEFYKQEAALTRINYPELSERYKRTAELLEQLNALVEFGVVSIEVNPLAGESNQSPV